LMLSPIWMTLKIALNLAWDDKGKPTGKPNTKWFKKQL
jgi:hypothetical protein